MRSPCQGSELFPLALPMESKSSKNITALSLLRAVSNRHFRRNSLSPTKQLWMSVGRTVRQDVALQGDTTVVEQTLELSGAKPWDEFAPNLQTLTVRCGQDARTVTYGLRDFKRAGDHIEVNGRRIFLRGTLNCCVYPLTGTPPLDEKGWEKEFQVVKDWGLNHVRFHSWCPPDAAFRAADRMGLYLQVELPDWARNIGQPEMNRFLKDEYDREAFDNMRSEGLDKFLAECKAITKGFITLWQWLF